MWVVQEFHTFPLFYDIICGIACYSNTIDGSEIELWVQRFVAGHIKIFIDSWFHISCDSLDSYCKEIQWRADTRSNQITTTLTRSYCTRGGDWIRSQVSDVYQLGQCILVECCYWCNHHCGDPQNYTDIRIVFRKIRLRNSLV